MGLHYRGIPVRSIFPFFVFFKKNDLNVAVLLPIDVNFWRYSLQIINDPNAKKAEPHCDFPLFGFMKII